MWPEGITMYDKEHKFEWIGTKCQLSDPLTKPGSEKSFFEL